MLSAELKSRIKKATVKLTRLAGQGVLVPGNLIATAAHCVYWSTEGEMVLGDSFPEPIRAERCELTATPYAVEQCSDLAVLGALDSQSSYKEFVEFDKWCAATEPVQLSTVDNYELLKPFPVHILTYRGEWVRAKAQKCSPLAHTVHVTAESQIEGGTSGGPVVDESGRLVGVVSHFSDGCDSDDFEGQVALAHLSIPPRLLRNMFTMRKR
jgi:Trypsin-like peptidase domain